MHYERPSSWQEALEIKAQRPDAVPLLGGTDLLVDINFGRSRPPFVLDLSATAEIRGWTDLGDRIRVGAGMTYAEVIDQLGTRLSGLGMAARTVGSPQIRNRGTLAGNLGSASPAGDAHPPLLAAGAEVEVASVHGSRRMPIDEFYVGPKRNALDSAELIAAVHVPAAVGARQEQFAKIGTRNAMVIAACSFAVSLDRQVRRVGTGVGAAGPTPFRAHRAERFLEGVLTESDAWDGGVGLDGSALERFGELVAEAAQPIDDVRASARYRRHALAILARRTVAWAHASNGNVKG